MNLYPHFRLLRGASRRASSFLELTCAAGNKTWLVPRGPPTLPHERHLAVERELAPENLLGSATCWDAGPAEIRKWLPRHIVVVLHGARLRGCFALVRLTRAAHAHWLWTRVNPPLRPATRRTKSALSALSP